MKDLGIQPDKRHISMAMFACVISETNNLAESLLALYVRMGGVPDTALYTLLLRSLLQQKKWNEGNIFYINTHSLSLSFYILILTFIHFFIYLY